MVNNIPNIWELYGVKENPFSTSPLLVLGGILPIESFVGRNDEVKRLSKILGSKGGSRTLVYGDVGVGKTTFVNVVRHNAFINNFFTPVKEIAIQEDWSNMDFIMNTLAGIYVTEKLLSKEPNINKEQMKKLSSLLEVGNKNVSWGIDLGGFGGNYSSERKTTHPTISALQDFFEELVKSITDKTGNDMIIHYNNLELLSEKKIRSLFNNLRDFFQTKSIHFIFVGNLTVHSTLQTIPRFSSNLTDTPFNIENLSYTEIGEIIKLRFKSLNIKDINYFIPYTENGLKSLYNLFNGNIRNILNSLSTAVLEATEEQTILLDRNKLAEILNRIVENRYLSNLTPRMREVLLEIVKHSEITNKSLSDKLKIPRSNLSSWISDLVRKGCVYLRRKNGKDKFWSAEPKIKWFLLREDDKNQRTIGDYRKY